MQSRKQCALPVMTTMALWQLMHLGTSCTYKSIRHLFNKIQLRMPKYEL